MLIDEFRFHLLHPYNGYQYGPHLLLIEPSHPYLEISIDETTDDTRRHVANVVIGILSSNDYEGRKIFY